MSDFVLYNYFRSSTSYRVRIAMQLKNISFKYHPVHLLNNGGEQHTAEYRQLSPAGEVPTLVHGNFKLGQSMAIIEYLDQVVAEPRLLPAEPQMAGRVRQFCENINCVHAYGNLKTLAKLKSDFAITDEQKNQWIHHWAHESFQVTEKILSESAGSYCFGHAVTAADVFLAPQIFSALRFGVDLQPYPQVRRVAENCENLAAFRLAHPYRQPDTLPELRIP